MLNKSISIILAAVLFTGVMTGCADSNSSGNSTSEFVPNQAQTAARNEENSSADSAAETVMNNSASTLYVGFGNSQKFELHLNGNETANAIAYYVGTEDWRLPIYHFDDYENWEIMQYYDIPSRYEIPSNPEQITEEKAGTVYYSEPNRVILYFGDGQVSAEYTPIGYIDYSEELVKAVEENPEVEGWGNKIVNISAKP